MESQAASAGTCANDHTSSQTSVDNSKLSAANGNISVDSAREVVAAEITATGDDTGRRTRTRPSTRAPELSRGNNPEVDVPLKGHVPESPPAPSSNLNRINAPEGESMEMTNSAQSTSVVSAPQKRDWGVTGDAGVNTDANHAHTRTVARSVPVEPRARERPTSILDAPPRQLAVDQIDGTALTDVVALVRRTPRKRPVQHNFGGYTGPNFKRFVKVPPYGWAGNSLVRRNLTSIADRHIVPVKQAGVTIDAMHPEFDEQPNDSKRKRRYYFLVHCR